MNKGLKVAKGERVWFLNAGDRFYSSDSIKRVASIPETIDICFGEVILEDEQGQNLGPRSAVTPHKLPQNLQKSDFKTGMVVSHQAFIVRRDIAPNFTTESYRFSSDLDWMLRILSKPKTSLNLGILARAPRAGATMQNWRESQWERFCILADHFGLFHTMMAHFSILIRRFKHALCSGYWR